jgi:hypothetical protein
MDSNDAQPADSPEPQLLQLDAVEARVVGCLIEKAALTPDAYPLTANATLVACNQKTSREPVLELELGEVGHALRRLEDKGLVKVVHGSRALRYEHRFDETYTVTPRQRALLCLMLLRGPQTLNELHTRAERLAGFPTLDDTRDTLERLCTRTPPMAVRLGRAPGQREDRYMHLLCGPVSPEMPAAATASASGRADASALEQRVEALEAEVDALKRTLSDLRDQLSGLL